MKRCPECRRDYYDDTLLYCLDDGSALLDGPANDADLPTVVMPGPEFHAERPPLRAADAAEVANTSNAIAVLPFANLSQSDETEYFADGLAEELLSVLSRIKGLRVMARTSAFSFKGKQMSVEEIGRSLRVRSVLEGSVRTAGDRVRIAVHLVDVEQGFRLWSGTYDRTMNDIFAIQDDIARSVVEQVRSKLTGDEAANLRSREISEEVAAAVKGRGSDPEAHRLVLIGRHLLERANQDDMKKAVGYFQQALEIDSDHAPAWAQLGRAHLIGYAQLLTFFDFSFEQAEAFSKNALRLDPDLADAHAVLGAVRQMHLDFAGAEQCFRRALELAPENSYVIRKNAGLARDLGRFDEALLNYAHALLIDPLCSSNWLQSGWAHFCAGHLAEAEVAFRRVLELAPQRKFAHSLLALVLDQNGRADEAITEAMLEPDERFLRPWSMAIIHHAAGRESESAAELAKLDPDETPFQIAEVHSMRGEIDKAFEWLELTVARSDSARIQTKVSPFLRSLHRDLRWRPLLRTIGFPEGETNAA